MVADRIRVVLGVAVTLGVIQVVPDRRLVAAILLLVWAVLFSPLTLADGVLFVLAVVFFVGQNYASLSAGIFEFRHKDILLMPWYEPLLWGFYYLALKRFVAPKVRPPRIGVGAVAGLAATSVVFSLFTYSSHVLLAATICSTLLLFAFFHTALDLAFALAALVLGFVVELFGVTTGLWSYPEPDLLGMPFWFATMWISVGVLGWRFAMPAAEWIAAGLSRQRA
ncbi:MAG: hypothetical protein JSU08_16175 [Acidobacteria bacterium]|nr:hypothetical protein [Acidobacteriota bacterium]